MMSEIHQNENYYSVYTRIALLQVTQAVMDKVTELFFSLSYKKIFTNVYTMTGCNINNPKGYFYFSLFHHFKILLSKVLCIL